MLTRGGQDRFSSTFGVDVAGAWGDPQQTPESGTLPQLPPSLHRFQTRSNTETIQSFGPRLPVRELRWSLCWPPKLRGYAVAQLIGDAGFHLRPRALVIDFH
jgi:hypothetical protein